jgi:hypothetical protein
MQKTLTKQPAANRRTVDEILPKYDFSNGRRNKYASHYSAGSVVVVLDPAVAAPSEGRERPTRPFAPLLKSSRNAVPANRPPNRPATLSKCFSD